MAERAGEFISRLYFSHRLLAAAVCAAVLLSGATLEAPLRGRGAKTDRARQRQLQQRAEPPRMLTAPGVKLAPGADSTQEREIGEDVNARAQWFLFQRTYPSREFPTASARFRAFGVATRNRLRQRRLAGAAVTPWRPIGPAPTEPLHKENWGALSGRINSIAISPANSSLVLIGSTAGGVWRSTNAGASFTPVTDAVVGNADSSVAAIAFSKSNPSIVYAGFGDDFYNYLGNGLLKSTDAGASWTRIGDTYFPSGIVEKIEVHPEDPNRIYMAQFGKIDKTENRWYTTGFYLSTDGGASWRRTFIGEVRDLASSPTDPKTLYLAATYTFDQSRKLIPQSAGLYRSTDKGGTWSPIKVLPNDVTKTAFYDLRVAAGRGNSVYFYMGLGAGGRCPDGANCTYTLAHSTDAGATWAERGTDTIDKEQFGYNTYLSVDPNNANTVYVGSRDVYKSTDAGATWSNLTSNFEPPFKRFLYKTSKIHPDQRTIAFDPKNSSTIYVGNDGGIWKSVDGGATFQSLNASLSLSLFMGIAINPLDPSITYGGTQDNGTQRRQSSGLWNDFSLGDGGKCIAVATSAGVKVFSSYPWGAIARWSDDGRQVAKDGRSASSYYVVNTSSYDKDRVSFYPPIVGNGRDATVYLGTYRLWMSTDLGETWSAPGGATDLTRGTTNWGGDVLSSIGVSPAESKVIYTGSSQGKAMMTTDAGATWKDITFGLPNRTITSLTVDAKDWKTAYATVSGFGTGHVFKTIDAGATWIDVSGAGGVGALPNIPTNALLIDPSDSKTIYVGTDIGVFKSSAGGGSWVEFNQGMPPSVVNAFAVGKNGAIQAATFGRGVFELQPAKRSQP